MQRRSLHKLSFNFPPSVYGNNPTSQQNLRILVLGSAGPREPIAHGSQWLHIALVPSAFRYIAYVPPWYSMCVHHTNGVLSLEVPSQWSCSICWCTLLPLRPLWHLPLTNRGGRSPGRIVGVLNPLRNCDASLCLCRVLRGRVENTTAAVTTHICHIGNEWMVSADPCRSRGRVCSWSRLRLRFRTQMSMAEHTGQWVRWSRIGFYTRCNRGSDGELEAGVEAAFDFCDAAWRPAQSETRASMEQASVMVAFSQSWLLIHKAESFQNPSRTLLRTQGRLATLGQGNSPNPSPRWWDHQT